jgi:hypothetical protein
LLAALLANQPVHEDLSFRGSGIFRLFPLLHPKLASEVVILFDVKNLSSDPSPVSQPPEIQVLLVGVART